MTNEPGPDRRNSSQVDRRREWSRGGRRATDRKEPRWFEAARLEKKPNEENTKA
jgi:hypothetical protein